MKKWLLILTTFILPILSFSQSGGNGVYNFLDLTNSARLASLGGYNISVYNEDLNFAAQNPSLLNPIHNNKITLNYIDYFAGINFGYTAYARDYGNLGTFAGGVHYINYGKFIRAEDNGIINGEFKASEYALNLIWAKEIYKNTHLGINFKPIFSNLESYNSFGIAIDMGVSYIIKEKEFCASLVAKNIGFQIKPYYAGHYEKLPFELQAGVSKKLAHAPFRISLTGQKLNKWNLLYETEEEITSIAFAADVDTTKGEVLYNFLDNSFRHMVIGVDILLMKSFYLSLGYNHLRHQELKITDKAGITGFSWGFGVTLKKIGINYARSSYHLAGGSNHFSLQFDISQFSKTKSVEIIKNE